MLPLDLAFWAKGIKERGQEYSLACIPAVRIHFKKNKAEQQEWNISMVFEMHKFHVSWQHNPLLLQLG